MTKLIFDGHNDHDSIIDIVLTEIIPVYGTNYYNLFQF